jgi:predicted dithiol-disulfide oxidoreductase (DUF899 family)
MARTAPKTSKDRKATAKTITDHTLYDNSGKEVRLSQLFGQHHQLIILHNMGQHCPNCALWGDEFNGMLKHLEKQASFCIVGPDDPATQQQYVKERGWTARLLSARGTSFVKELGFEEEDGAAKPGVSILSKGKDGEITIVQQCHVDRDGRAPSVLEVLWMTPGVAVEQIAWPK